MQFKRAGNKLQCLIYVGYDSAKKRSKQRLIASISLYGNDIPEALNEYLTEADLAKLVRIRDAYKQSDNTLIQQSDNPSLYDSQTRQLADSIASGAITLDDNQRAAILAAIDQLKSVLQPVADNRLFTVDDAAKALSKALGKNITVRSRILDRAKQAARAALNINSSPANPVELSMIYQWIIENKAK